MQTLPWIVAIVALSLLATVLGTWGWRNSRKARPPVVPSDWAIAARPVFGADERRAYRLLREALPHQVVLSKLPLVRFCQPTDPSEVRYWYNLLGSSQVTFAICSASGRVLAAIDLDSDRSESRRRMQIKQSVLSACRIRYLRCSIDQMPTAAELQLLVPSAGPNPRAPQPPAAAGQPLDIGSGGGDGRSAGATARRAERTPLWQDSAVLHDSFFTPEPRQEAFDGGGSYLPPTAPPPRSSSAWQRRRASDAREFHETDFDATRFRPSEFDPEAAAEEGDDQAGSPSRPPRFHSGSRR